MLADETSDVSIAEFMTVALRCLNQMTGETMDRDLGTVNVKTTSSVALKKRCCILSQRAICQSTVSEDKDVTVRASCLST